MTISNNSTEGSNTSFRFSIGATFTAQPLKPVIDFWGRQLHIPFDVRFAPYNQLEQALLDPAGEFGANTGGVNVIAIRIEDFGQPGQWDMGRIRSNIDHLLDALRSAHFKAPSILCLCPPSQDFDADSERSGAADQIARVIATAAGGLAGIQFLHHSEVAALYPAPEYEAAGGEELGHVPYTETYYVALGTLLARRAHALTRAPFKVIALDCDNTLWAGICGEDGPAGVVIDPPRRELQEFMLAQRGAGMLLVMASKNNESDVLEVFERGPAMPLRLRDFAAWRIDWESKPDNLNALSRDLNVGLDTFILVDDNPKECAEVETGAPEVLTVPLPAAADEILHFLRHVWAFDHSAITEEDRKRGAYYEQGQRFGAELRRSSNLEQFIAGLDLRVRIEHATAEQLPRVAQLTQRTNQFNFTAVRRTEADLKSLLALGSHECFTVEVSDRFGDYGLVGAMIVEAAPDALAIDTFLLSCRALGRGVEHRMMAFLAERGKTAIVATLKPTRQNAPAQQFLDSIGREWKRELDGALEFRLPAASVAGLRWKPAVPPVRPAGAETSRAPHTQHATPDYARIARALSTPESILNAMRRQIRDGAPGQIAAPTDPPSTPTERRLAEIWADLLRTPSISASDNFFDLGGHSLLVVLLLVRVQETFGVQLPIDDVYSAGVTLADLAQRIELLQIGEPDSPEYVELLREIEAMSDEEARRLLAETEPDGGRS